MKPPCWSPFSFLPPNGFNLSRHFDATGGGLIFYFHSPPQSHVDTCKTNHRVGAGLETYCREMRRRCSSDLLFFLFGFCLKVRVTWDFRHAFVVDQNPMNIMADRN